MILKKQNYHYARKTIELHLELYPDKNRLDLARQLVHITMAPILIVYSMVLEIGGHDEELHKEFSKLLKWYKGITVE